MLSRPLHTVLDLLETTGGDEVEALLDSGSLAGDFIAKRVVSQLKLEHHVVSLVPAKKVRYKIFVN